jgi:isochorismate hydrolase
MGPFPLPLLFEWRKARTFMVDFRIHLVESQSLSMSYSDHFEALSSINMRCGKVQQAISTLVVLV